MRRAAHALAGAAALLCCTATVQQARAQSMEYGPLEQMFGEPVTDSVTGTPQRASEAPADLDIVTAEQIRRSGADNIPDVLRFVAGLDVRRYGMADAAVSIRGDNTALSPRVLVLIDGRQVYQDDYGVTIWSSLPIAVEEIRQIEIIKGPSAALYGFNAVSGVINIVTYDPLHDAVNTARIDAGTQDAAGGEAVATARIPGQLGVRISAEGIRSREFDGPQDGGEMDPPRIGGVNIDARAMVAPGIEWDLSGSYTSFDSLYYVDLGTYAPIGERTNHVRSQLSAESGLGLLHLDVYRNQERHTDETPVNADSWRDAVTVVKGSDIVKLGPDHTVRAELEYRDSSVASLAQFQGRLGYQIEAASLMWNWQMTSGLSLTNAIRVDHLSLAHDGAQLTLPGASQGLYWDRSITEPSFNSGLVYRASDRDTMRVTAARAIQLPSLIDFGFTNVSPLVVVAGSPGLQPSAVMNYELDYDRSLPRIGATFRAATFFERTDSVILSPFGSGFTFLPNGQLLLESRNIGYSTDFGGELTLSGKSRSGLHWNASYALAAVHDHSPSSVLDTAPDAGLQNQTPTSVVILGAGYSWGRFDLDGQARWQSHYLDYRADLTELMVREVLVPNYITTNVRLGYRVSRQLTLAVTAEQLNQQQIVESAGLEVERRFIATAVAKF